MQTLFATLAAAMLGIASVGAATVDPERPAPTPLVLLVLPDDNMQA